MFSGKFERIFIIAIRQRGIVLCDGGVTEYGLYVHGRTVNHYLPCLSEILPMPMSGGERSLIFRHRHGLCSQVLGQGNPHHCLPKIRHGRVVWTACFCFPVFL